MANRTKPVGKRVYNSLRKALAQYRKNVFPALQETVNAYLDKFGVGFSIGRLSPVNQRSGSACTYDILIQEHPVAVKGGNLAPGEPSFSTTLSGGDRSSLALAVFFSELDQKLDLSETVVVIDDPMTSLDEHRALTTAQTIRECAKKAGQVIVLSHNKSFLSEVVSGVRQTELGYVSLEIVQGDKGSIIRSWDISQDWESLQYRRYALLTRYHENPSGDVSPEEASSAIRPYLESYLEGSYAGNFKGKSTIGTFLGECKRKLGTPDEILNEPDYEELRSIHEYANRPHHSGSGDVKINNATQLRAFVKRALDFVRRRR